MADRADRHSGQVQQTAQGPMLIAAFDRYELPRSRIVDDPLAIRMTNAGYDLTTPAMFVWEGVTQYLTEPAVRATLASLASAVPTSRLIFSYILDSFLQGTDRHDADVLYRRFVIKNPIWHFGLEPEQIAPLLAEYGWTVREDVGPAEYRDRYFGPAGRELSAMEIERFVAADR